MARRQVLEIVCDRCDRTETQPLVEGTERLDQPEFEAVFGAQKLKFQDLCTRCRKALEGYFKSIAMQKDEKKPESKKASIIGLGKRTG